MQEMQASKATSQFLEGLDYPIGKAEIVAAAREANFDATIMATFEKLFDRSYESAADVATTLNA